MGAAGWADLLQAEDRAGPIWLPDGSLLVLVSDAGRNIPYRVTLDGTPAPLVEAGRVVGAGLDVSHSGRIALSAAVDARAGELYGVEDGRIRRISADGSAWQSRFPRARWEERRAAGPGGAIQYWLASPEDAGTEPMPTVLVIHGGPTGSAGPGGTLDSTMLTAHGYRVVMPNIRGSAGFGSAWIAALGGRWGDVDAADAMAVIDAVLDGGLADPARLGVMGLSYGGFLTQWLIGVTDRFGAAVAENGVANQVSTWANSHFGIHYNRRARLGDPLTEDGMLQLWHRSPLANARQMTTPLLHASGGGGSHLPRVRQRAAVHRAPGAGPRGGVRPLPGGAPRDEEPRPAGSAHRPHGADPGLVRRPSRAAAAGRAPQPAVRSGRTTSARVARQARRR